MLSQTVSCPLVAVLAGTIGISVDICPERFPCFFRFIHGTCLIYKEYVINPLIMEEELNTIKSIINNLDWTVERIRGCKLY